MKSLAPNLAVKNISETIKYYVDNFGFELQMAIDESKEGFDTQIDEDKNYIWAIIKSGDIEIIFQEKNDFKNDIGSFFDEIGSSSTIYINMDNVEILNSLYIKLQNSKNKIEIYKEIETTWYGQREFYIKDINGYILGFASRDV
jgi:uncharacterized glyoxalase superfamily protein PhnB